MYWEHVGNCAVRRGQWKLVREFGQPWELYDLSEGRTEEHDVAAEHPDLVATLVADYEQWAARVGVIPHEQIRELYRSDKNLAGHVAPGDVSSSKEKV